MSDGCGGVTPPTQVASNVIRDFNLNSNHIDHGGKSLSWYGAIARVTLAVVGIV